jgi:uncharacterized protein YjbI with pentapeptide repeats
MTIKQKHLEGFEMTKFETTNETAAVQKMDFSKSRLKNSDLADATLNQGNFEYSDLGGSDFSHADR